MSALLSGTWIFKNIIDVPNEDDTIYGCTFDFTCSGFQYGNITYGKSNGVKFVNFDAQRMWENGVWSGGLTLPLTIEFNTNNQEVNDAFNTWLRANADPDTINVSITKSSGEILLTREKYCDKDIKAIPVLENKSIVANGTYNASNGNCGLGEVIVNVPNPSTGTLNITENGTYDVTNKASASVNIDNFAELNITTWGTES